MEQRATKVKKVKKKTPSQKVRAILYCHWDLKQPTDTFDEFYETEMDKIVNALKKSYLK